jgi:hypothetical protein
MWDFTFAYQELNYLAVTVLSHAVSQVLQSLEGKCQWIGLEDDKDRTKERIKQDDRDDRVLVKYSYHMEKVLKAISRCNSYILDNIMFTCIDLEGVNILMATMKMHQ